MKWWKKIFRTRGQKLDELCDVVYKENIGLIYYFLTEKCQLNKEESHVVMLEAVGQMAENIEDYYGMEKRERGEKFFNDTYKIAKETYPKILEVCYDSKKSKE